jgi:hypothetical protein
MRSAAGQAFYQFPANESSVEQGRDRNALEFLGHSTKKSEWGLPSSISLGELDKIRRPKATSERIVPGQKTAQGSQDLQARQKAHRPSSSSDTAQYETGSNAEKTIRPEIIPKEAEGTLVLASGETIW